MSDYLSGLVVFSKQLIPLNDGLGPLLARHVPLLPDHLDVLAGLAQLLLGFCFVLHFVAVLLQQLVPLADGPVPVHQWRVQLLYQNKGGQNYLHWNGSLPNQMHLAEDALRNAPYDFYFFYVLLMVMLTTLEHEWNEITLKLIYNLM